jgi:hypothetical protein
VNLTGGAANRMKPMNDFRNPPAWGKLLNEDDYRGLGHSWITPELVDLAMIRRVDAIQGREVIGQKGNRDCAGLLIPYYWPGEPSPFNYRVRRDNPEWEEGKGGQLSRNGNIWGPQEAPTGYSFPQASHSSSLKILRSRS